MKFQGDPRMPVEISGGMLRAGGRPLYPRCGEIHYFNIKRGEWRQRILLLKEARMDSVSIYIPWSRHEGVEGEVDLDGSTCPEKDLKTFLDICAAEDVGVIVNPGPSANSGLDYLSYPEWLFKKYPETVVPLALQKSRSRQRVADVGNNVLRDLVRRWYSVLVALLSSYRAERGGPVMLCRPGNEVSHLEDYPSVNGAGGLWQRWLERRYGGRDGLRERYPGIYGESNVIAIPGETGSSIRDSGFLIDWINFKEAFLYDWGALLCEWIVESGLNAPFLFNARDGGFHRWARRSDSARRLEEAGINVLPACMIHADRIIDLDGAGSIEKSVERVNASSSGIFSMSLETSYTCSMPRFSRNHVVAGSMLRLALGQGLNGLSLYPFASGPGHWEDAPLSSAGELNPVYSYLHDFFGFVAAWEQDIPATVTRPDLLIGTSPAISGIPFADFKMSPVQEETLPEDDSLSSLTEFLTLLRRMNISWGLLDLTAPRIEPGGCKLVLPCPEALEREAVDYILHHIESGGKALFFPSLPLKNIDGRPDIRIGSKLGVSFEREACPLSPEVSGRIIFHGSENEKVFASFEGRPFISSLRHPGRSIVLSGAYPCYRNSDDLQLWKNVFSFLGIDSAVSIEGGHLYTAVRKNPDSSSILMVLSNILGDETEKRIYIKDRGISFPKNCYLQFAPCETRMLWCFLPLEENILMYITHELIPVGNSRKFFQVRGRCGDMCELAFKENCGIAVDGENVELVKKEGVFTCNFRFNSPSAVLKIVKPLKD